MASAGAEARQLAALGPSLVRGPAKWLPPPDEPRWLGDPQLSRASPSVLCRQMKLDLVAEEDRERVIGMIRELPPRVTAGWLTATLPTAAAEPWWGPDIAGLLGQQASLRLSDVSWRRLHSKSFK